MYSFSSTACFSAMSRPAWRDSEPRDRVPVHVVPPAGLEPGQLQREYIDRGLPVLLKGFARPEVARGVWTPASLSALAGNREVVAQFGYAEQERTSLLRVVLREFLELIEDEAGVRDFADGGPWRV